MNIAEVWVDKETSVNYLYHASGYSVNAPYPVPFLSFEKLR